MSTQTLLDRIDATLIHGGNRLDVATRPDQEERAVLRELHSRGWELVRVELRTEQSPLTAGSLGHPVTSDLYIHFRGASGHSDGLAATSLAHIGTDRADDGTVVFRALVPRDGHLFVAGTMNGHALDVGGVSVRGHMHGGSSRPSMELLIQHDPAGSGEFTFGRTAGQTDQHRNPTENHIDGDPEHTLSAGIDLGFTQPQGRVGGINGGWSGRFGGNSTQHIGAQNGRDVAAGRSAMVTPRQEVPSGRIYDLHGAGPPQALHPKPTPTSAAEATTPKPTLSALTEPYTPSGADGQAATDPLRPRDVVQPELAPQVAVVNVVEAVVQAYEATSASSALGMVQAPDMVVPEQEVQAYEATSASSALGMVQAPDMVVTEQEVQAYEATSASSALGMVQAPDMVVTEQKVQAYEATSASSALGMVQAPDMVVTEQEVQTHEATSDEEAAAVV